MKKQIFLISFFGVLLTSTSYSVETTTVPGETPVVSVPPQPAPTPVLPEQPQQVLPAKKKTSRFAVGLLAAGPEKMKFEDGTATTGGVGLKFQTELEMEPMLGLLIEFHEMPKHSWGLQGGVIVELDRKIKSQTTTIGSVVSNSSFPNGNPKWRNELIYLNAVYRWEVFYVPFGLNYSIPHFTRSPTSTGTANVEGAFGAQVGIGLQATDYFGFELLVQSTGAKLSGVSDPYSIDYGTGYTSGLRLQTKFCF